MATTKHVGAYDFSTLDEQALRRLTPYKRPPTYHLQREPGNGCFLDPPGYPTYFTRSVYTRYGNNPSRGAQTVITGGDGIARVVESREDWTRGMDWDAYRAKIDARLHKLYKPLPIDHPRMQAWLAALFGHFRHCYRDTERLEYGKPGTLIWPVPAYKLKSFRDDVRWSAQYRTAAQAEIDAFNMQERDRAQAIATLDNHLAVIYVRKYYPAFTPNPQWLDTPPLRQDWDWERGSTASQTEVSA